MQRYVATLPQDNALVVAWRNQHPEWLEPVVFGPDHGKHKEVAKEADREPHRESHRESGSQSHREPDSAESRKQIGKSVPLRTGQQLQGRASMDHARDRWALYNREGLIKSISSEEAWEAKLREMVGRGLWLSVDTARDELTRVKPWTIARIAKDSTDAVFRVRDKLSAA